MFCKNCGKEMANGSKFCGECGAQLIGEAQKKETPTKTAPEKQSASQKKVGGCFLIFIVIVAFYAFSKLSDSCNSTSKTVTSKPKYADLEANIKIQNGNIIIKNLNDYNWTPTDTWEGKAIKLKLNNKFIFYQRATMISGVEYKIHVSMFAKKDGTRFNLLIYKPKNISIGCKENSGYFTWR